MKPGQRKTLVTKHLKKHETELSERWCLGSVHRAQKTVGADGLDAAFRAIFDDHAEDLDPEFDYDN